MKIELKLELRIFNKYYYKKCNVKRLQFFFFRGSAKLQCSILTN